MKTYNIADHIDERISYLKELHASLVREYAKMPEGELLVSPGSTKNSFRYYLRESTRDKCGLYLDKSRTSDKKKYATKKYYKVLLKNIDSEIKKLEIIKKLGMSDSIKNTYKSLNPGVKKLINPIDVDDETYSVMWMEEKYDGLGFDPRDQSAFYSDKGERMRSKSEVLIANTLNKMNIVYKYECPVARINGELLYPDFTVLDLKRRKVKYWEHLGRMDDTEYVNRNLWKLEEYRKIDIRLGLNLFLTYESGSNPLGTNEINNVIQSIIES